MKMILRTLFLLLLVTIVLPACKKGENDPFISLRTRKARVVGEWKTTYGKGHVSATGSSASNASWNYDGTTYILDNSLGINSYLRTIEYTFKKDGTFIINDMNDGKLYIKEGTWNFTGGAGNTKRKSELVLSYTKMTDESGTDTFSGLLPFTFKIDELRNNKMVLKSVYHRTDPNGTEDVSEEWVLETK